MMAFQANEGKSSAPQRGNNGRAFEIRSAEVLEALLQSGRNGESVRIRHDVRLRGASGVLHQIDLDCRLDRSDGCLRFLVECRDRKRAVCQEQVAAFSSVLKDLGLPGVMVSSGGFQAGAVRYAAWRGILLLELRKPGEGDWEKYKQSFLRGGGSRKLAQDMSVHGTGSMRVRIFPEPGKEGGRRPGCSVPDTLNKDPDLMLLVDPERGKRWQVERLIKDLRPVKGKTHQRIVLKTPGCRLTHPVWGWEIPVRALAFEFDDLTEDFRDTILYGEKRPDLLLVSHAGCTRINLFRQPRGHGPGGWRAGLRAADPVREVFAGGPVRPVPGPEEGA